MPDGCQQGSRLRISLPGIEEKVVVTVPAGAVPGRSISFTLKGLPDAKEAEAAATIQARQRGKASRTQYTPRGHAAPPYEGSAAPTGRPDFYAANYPSLAPSAAADDDDVAVPPAAPASRFVYTPRGAAQASTAEPAAAVGGSPQPRHDAALYPSLSPGGGAARDAEEPAAPPVSPRAIYTPRGHAAPPAEPTHVQEAATHDPALYPSLHASAADEPADTAAPPLADRSPVMEAAASIGAAIGGGLSRMATATGLRQPAATSDAAEAGEAREDDAATSTA